MLHRTLESAIVYLETLIQTPQPLLYQLGLGSWCGWFYVFVVTCKLIFLEENERSGHTDVEDMPGEINNLVPDDIVPKHLKLHDVERNDSIAGVTGSNNPGGDSSWDALAVTEQYGLLQLSDRVMKKLTFSLPEDFIPWHKPREERDSLYPISCLHKIMLQGFAKRIERLASAKATSSGTSYTIAAATAPAQSFSTTSAWQAPHTDSDDARRVLGLPFSNFMNFDALNFDGVTLPSTTFPQEGGQEMLGDYMWDMVMDDFTMPQL
jgi:hypothetical protein